MSPTSPKLKAISNRKTTRSVLLCGASVRSLAESAIAAGLRPLCIDFFEDADLTQILSRGRGRFAGRIDSFAQLPERVRSVRTSIPLLWAGGLENYSDVLREIGRSRPVIGPAPDCVDQLRDPWMLQDWLGEVEIGVPRLATEATADSDCHWLRKSVASSGGFGINLHHRDRQNSQPPDVCGEYLQEYIDGVPMSATLCSDQSGVHLFGMSLQLIGWPSLGASGFLFCGNVGPVDPGERVTQQVLEAARVLVDRSGMRGVFGIDFILRQGRAWFLEVNPRVTASHMLFELQQPGRIIHRHLAALDWMPVCPRRSLEKAATRTTTALSPVAARLILWARENLRVPAGLDVATCSTFKITDRPCPGALVPGGSPLCSIQLTAKDVDEIIQQLILLENMSSATADLSLGTLHSWGYSTHTIAGQLQLLWQRFPGAMTRS